MRCNTAALHASDVLAHKGESDELDTSRLLVSIDQTQKTVQPDKADEFVSEWLSEAKKD